MATAIELEIAGELHKYDPVLDEDEQELRILWASPKLKDWIGNGLPQLASDFGVETAPLGQFDAFMDVYASGLPLVFEKQFKAFQGHSLQALEDGVWYLKTTDLRIFGWFWKKDCFIGVVADTAFRVKEHNLYQGYRGEVVRFRDKLLLDEPKFIPGTNPDAVISNYDLPD